MSKTTTPIGIIGAGAWGTALAQVLAMSGHEVLLLSDEGDTITDINRRHQNGKYLPGINLHNNISATNKLEPFIEKCTNIFIAVPSPAFTEIATQVGPKLSAEQTVVIGTKGFRESDGALLSDVWLENSPNCRKLAVLGGPSAAIDVAAGKPTSVVIAANAEEVVYEISDLFTASWFRVYYSTDMIGVQVGAALRNAYAIAAGVCAGLELGHNATAAVISRATAEMARYATTLGGQSETVMGLAGLGDLWLAIASGLSRNYRFGKALGKGMTAAEAMEREGTVEGAVAAHIANFQAAARGVDLGLVGMVDAILHGDLKPQAMLEMMLMRPRVWEFAAPQADTLHEEEGLL